MGKRIPEQLRFHILPFNWNVEMVWALEAPVNKIERSTLDYLLHLSLWSSISGKGMLFDISPIEVLRDLSSFPHQAERIERADVSFPIDMIDWKGKIWILDGVHRLAKLYKQEANYVKARIHASSVVQKIEDVNQLFKTPEATARSV